MISVPTPHFLSYYPVAWYMGPMHTLLDEHLTDTGVDGYLILADGEDPNQRYLTDFFAPDPFNTLYTDGQVHILVMPHWYDQARTESRADSVTNLASYGFVELLEDHGPHEAEMRALLEFLADNGIEAVSVPTDFPASVLDRLREEGVRAEPEAVHPTYGGIITEMRATKTDTEVEYIHAAQRANEAAMATVEGLLSDATIKDGTLHHDGEVLTVERVETELEMELLRQGCVLHETLLACGEDAAEPHGLGSGPLRANEPIVVDIFPQNKETKYFGDMTRTFVKGSPSDAIRDFYDHTLEAQQAAFDVIEAGTACADVYDAVCDVYEDAGYPTHRSHDSPERGFTVHGLGHGVGLSVHEPPGLGPGDENLKSGHVVTVEPGLYDPAIGGVRIEDIVVVTEDGFRNLNEYPKALFVE